MKEGKFSRRRYGVICCFFVASLLLALMCYGSYRYSLKVTEENLKEQEKRKTAEVGNNKEQRITSETRFIVELYHRDTEEIVTEERTMPSEYAGKTRSELLVYLKESLETAKKEEGEEYLSNIELVSFSKEQLILRKIYEEPEESAYYLTELDGEVVVYDGDKTKLLEKTGILTINLPAEEIQKLKQGYRVESEKDLYSILENFSS